MNGKQNSHKSRGKMATWTSRRCIICIERRLYANAADLWLFLFDSRNYYMDCIRMDENHILFGEKELSAVRNRFPSANYFCGLFFYGCFICLYVAMSVRFLCCVWKIFHRNMFLFRGLYLFIAP